MPCAELYERYLANGWQAKENCPDLKPVDASAFGRAIRKVFQMSRKSNEGLKERSQLLVSVLGYRRIIIPLPATLVHLTDVFHLGLLIQ